jgi:hypothetical protein
MVEIWGVFGRYEDHKFLPLKSILDEFKPKSITEEQIQRPIDEEQVNSILQSLLTRTTKQSVFTFTVAICNGERFLVDGQHRLAALRRLVDSIEDEEDKQEFRETVNVHVREINVDNQDDAVKLRDELGKARPVDAIGTRSGVRCQNLLHAFLSGCVNPPRSSTNPHYGNWSKDLESIVAQSGFYEKFELADDMIKEIKELNSFIFETVVRQNNTKYKEFITGGDRNKSEGKAFNDFREKFKQRNPDQVMCLALVIRYGFMEIVIDKVTRGMPDYNTYFQQAIKQKFKLNFNDSPTKETEKEVLKRFFGDNKVGEEAKKPCPVCSSAIVDKDISSSYHFGHIVSRASGGTNYSSNLIPVCHRCNLDCRAENMRDYCKRVYGRDFIL